MDLLILVTIFIFIPNLYFFIAQEYLFLVRAVINIDYIFPVLLAIYFRAPLISIVIFFIVFFLDLFSAGALAYFFDPAKLLLIICNVYYLKYSLSYIIGLLTCLAVSILYYVILKQRKDVKKISLTQQTILIGVVVIIILMDIINGTNRLSYNIDYTILPKNICTSVSYTIIDGFLKYKAQISDTLIQVDSATADLIKKMRNNDQNPIFGARHIVLIIVESLGLFKDERINQMLLAPFFENKITVRYNIRTGRVPFHGATTSAEFRELSGIKMDYLSALKGKIPASLPSYLKSLGFQTLAIHGFTKRFFERDNWYPLLGFQRMLFFEDILNTGKFRRCGSVFRGLCDEDVAAIVHKELLAVPDNERLFIYWLTLNSHLPLDKESLRNSNSSFVSDNQVELFQNETLCSFVKILHKSNSNICEIASDPKLPPTNFIIVGDHSPPFLNRDLRNAFIPNKVLSIELIPK